MPTEAAALMCGVTGFISIVFSWLTIVTGDMGSLIPAIAFAVIQLMIAGMAIAIKFCQ